ncbi:PEP/pyruvate-binding domain-containing protein [Flavobacterium procerum]|uniref:PEP/pyruvate-binding domain-containing protein n=1 Tax=Flavobacterium procerum TaxID=1455569 RepID=A0ABV6BRZ0_9FLAO
MMMNYYSYLDIPDLSFGGKADGLAFLVKEGFDVPPFFIIPNEAIQNVISGGLQAESLFKEWRSDANPDKDSLWALRSSAGAEDGTEKSYAGMFITVLNCTADELPAAFEEVLAGFKKMPASGYDTDNDVSFNMVLQEMVQGEISGVGFSVDPLNPDNENPVVSIIPGLGFKLVSGEENGMGIELADSPKIISKDDAYGGKVFDKVYRSMTLSGDALFLEAAPYLKEIRGRLIKLEQLKGYAVDAEFTISKNRIYWLQVRPVTSLVPKGDYTVWDNSNLAINYPGVTLPLTSSYMQHSYSMAYMQMCRFLGSGNSFIENNRSLFKDMLGAIKGGMYYNITAWQQLLFQLPFGNKTSRMITKMMGADEARFSRPPVRASLAVYLRLLLNLMKCMLFFGHYKKRYLNQYNRTREQFESTGLQAKGHQELIDIYREMESDLGKYWYPPMINGFFAMLSYNGLKKILLRSKMHDWHPNFLNDAIAGIGDVVSVEIVRTFGELIDRLDKDEAVKRIIIEEPAQKALHEIQLEHPEFYMLIKDYLDRFGERCDEGEMKMETVNYREDPSKFIALLKANLSQPYQERPPQKQFDYSKILKEHYMYRPFTRLLLSTGLKFAIARIRDRENFRFIRTKSFDMARRLFREMDKRLLDQGLIDGPRDSLYLHFEELNAPLLANSYKMIVNLRKQEYAGYQNEYQPERYHQIGDAFYPIEKKSSASRDCLSGTGCSSGIATGAVLQVRSPEIHDLDVKGKILVSSFFEPGWIGLFARAGGLVAERGSLLSHTAILCREMGIPFIVGAKNAASVLIDGEKVKINGATGSIEKVSIHE